MLGPPDRRSGPASRFRLWHGMVAIVAVALGFWAVATFDPIVWVVPAILGIGLLCSLVVNFLLILLLSLVAAALDRIGRGRALGRDGRTGPSTRRPGRPPLQ